MHESGQLFQRIAEHAPDVIYRYRLTPPRGFEYVSPAAAAITGYTPEEHYADPDLVFKLIHPDDRPLLETVARGETPPGAPLVLRWIRKDGTIIWTEQRNIPIFDRAGKLVAIEGIARSVTARMRAEQEMAERSRLLEALFTNTLTCLVLLDRNFNFIRVNEAYARACSRQVSEFPGHNHFEFYPSEARAIFEDVVKTKKPFQVFARPFVFPDHPDWGATYWDWTLVPILDSAGEVEYLVFTLNDVSERVRAEAERQKLASAVEQTDVGVVIVNRQGVVEFVNAALERIAGHSRQDLLGQTPSMFQSGAHSKEFYARLWGTITAGETFYSVFTNRTKEGKHIRVDETISPIQDAQGNVTHFVSVWKDITEQVQAVEERGRLFEQVSAGRERLQTLSRRLVEVQESERRHIARELHDEIGQTLTSLQLLINAAARPSRAGPGAPLAEAEQLAAELIDRVHNLSLDLRPSVLDDLGLLPALLWHFERYTGQTGVQVAFEHRGLDRRRFPAGVETAAYRIVQAALTNVARHASVESVTVHVWADSHTLGLRVTDEGVGFDARTALAAHASSGLEGMQERASLLGGRLTVLSAPGAGAQVVAEIPLGEPLERRKRGRGK
ncbi:MAG: PAS domain S-box protein [Chloroflexi bacterium]|nr:PAS domain S-box protein [Chloroflexota bacterium]